MNNKSISPNILLADSDATSREAFGSFFKQAGWCYDVVVDTTGILGALTAQQYDIVIADVTIPGIEGLALLKGILEKKPSQAIIAVNTERSFEEALKYFRVGAIDLLAKPVDFVHLEEVIIKTTGELRQEEKEGQLCHFVTSERTEIRFACRQLAQETSFSLPIINQLMLGGLLKEDAALRLRVAIQEAVFNALEHGNLELQSAWKEEILPDGSDRFSILRQERLQDPNYANRTVTICSWFNGSTLEITVQDQGKGFLNSDFSQKKKAEGELVCSGRGLALMSNAVDELRFNHNGSEVTLIKFINRNRS